MHLVTKSYFDTFAAEYEFESGSSKSFEAFANFCVANKYADDEFAPEDLIYEGDDPGIDGAMLFVDGRLMLTEDSLLDFLGAGTREHDFQFVFTQVKSGDRWAKRDIDTFHAAVSDFFEDDPALPHADFLIEFKKVFAQVYKSIKRVRGGLPNIACFYIVPAPEPNTPEIVGAATNGERAVAATGLFRSSEFSLIDRTKLHDLWQASDAVDEATIEVASYSAFPEASGVASAYVAPVSAREFIDKILRHPDGSRRKRLFEKNVRDFLGVDIEVNAEIASTLSDSVRRTRFGLMNNGATLVAETVRPTGQSIFIGNYQIVNGCQSSNVLLECDDDVDENVSIMLKIIETDDPATVDDIVRATNRQSTVEDEQFASQLNFLRDLETFFNARGAGQPNRLVFERRKGQYRNDGIPQARIVDVKELAKAIAATRLNRPDLASRFVGRLTGEMREEVFRGNADEDLLYLACFASYRLRSLLSNKRFDAKYSKLRWHVICATWTLSKVKFNEWECESSELAFENLFGANDGIWFDRLSGIISAALPDPDVSRDVLKGQTFTASMLERLFKELG